MKRLSYSVLLLALFALAAPRAEAQFAFLPYAGYDVDRGEALVGVGAEFGILQGALPLGLVIRPSAEYFFSGTRTEGTVEFDEELFVLNADLIAQLTPPIGLGLFAGAGLGAAFSSVSAVGFDDDTSTDLGLNLLLGAQFGGGFATPFVQGRYTTLGTSDRLAFMGGVRLGL